MSSRTPRSDLALFRRLLVQAGPYTLHIIGLFALGLLSVPLAMIGPLPLKIAVDSALGSHPLPRALAPPGVAPSAELALAIAVGLLIVTALLKQLQELSSQVLKSYLLEKLTLDLRARVFLHSQRLSLAHHDLRGTTDSVYRIQRDVPDAQSILIESVFPSVSSSLTLVGMLSVMARIDLQLAIAAIAISPLLFLINQHYRRRLRTRWHEVRNLETGALSVVQEALGALRVVKAFGQEHREHERFVDRSNAGVGAKLRMAFIEGSYGMQVGLLTVVGTAIVLFLGVRHVRSGVITLGEMLMVMGYLGQLYEPLRTLAKRAAGLQGKLTSAERVFALLDDNPDVVERRDARSLARAGGHVEFRNVSFAYGGGPSVLHQVTFDVPSGTRVGIAGPTGAGKTTLVSLLLRLYDPAEGAILLDGVDLRDIRLADLRRQYAMVLQEPVLFSTSIRENIEYARPGATREEIHEAARAANAHDFIVRLPRGYDTPVGERGMTLSGGERQRVSLARAFLKDSPILILDEPTSAVDLKAESLIMEALERLMHGRTTFIVAHRLSTIERCDLRLDVTGGHVVAGPPPAHAGGPLTA